MRAYFVARLPLEFYDYIHKELLEGRIRFTWGAEGLDLRNGIEKFVTTYLVRFGGEIYDAKRRYHVLSILMKIRVGDIILLPKVSVERPEIGNYFTVVECTEEYSFAPLPNNDFGHVIGVKILKTFNYRDVDSKINLAFRFRAINKISDPEIIQCIEELLRSLSPPPENDLKSMMEKVLATQESYLGEFLRGLKNLPPDAPSREEYSRKVLELLRTFLPATLKKIVKELFVKNGYHLTDEDDSGFTFEIFSERELMRDFYRIAAMPKIFVAIKNLGDSYEKLFAQFDKVADVQARILIDLTEQLDEKSAATAKEAGIIIVDGLTFANILARHKV